MTTLSSLKRQARAAGIGWADVQLVQREFAAVERQQREATDAVRRRAWESYCHWQGYERWRCLWRRGFRLVGSLLANSGRDFSAVPYVDVVAATLRSEFPEWAEADTGELLEFLCSDYQPEPPIVALYAAALDYILATAGGLASDYGAVPAAPRGFSGGDLAAVACGESPDFPPF
jgi:hypothetical protein